MSEYRSVIASPAATARKIFRVARWTPLVVLLFVLPPQGVAYSIDLKAEAQLKANYILNIAKLVEWPEDQAGAKDEKFLIGLYGDPYLWQACRRGLAGKDVADSRVAVTTLSRENATSPADGMKILFVYSDDEEELKDIIAALADRPVLLISDYPDFCELGGSIGLVWDDDRMLFEINRRQEARTGFRINSRLLRVARRVLE